MNERIPLLYDMVLRPEWIDFALEQWIKNPDEEKHRTCLREYLAGRVKGQEALIKTASQLQRNVGPRSPIVQERLQELYRDMTTLAPEQRSATRLAILEESTPFFADSVSALRKLTLVGVNEVPMSHLYERVSSRYGDRISVRRRLQYVLQTLAHLGLVERRGRSWRMRVQEDER